MSVPLHRDLPLGTAHLAYRWAYADATARTAATGVVAGDVGLLARQLDDNSLWLLSDDSPVTWVAVGGAGGTPLTTEQVQDAVAAMFAGGTHTDATVTYDDAAGTLDLAALSGGTTGSVSSVNVVIDGGGATITTGLKAFVRVPFAWTDIATASLLANAATTTVVDVWKDTYANHPPVDADSITASAPLTLSAADQTEVASASLTGWTKTGSAGDVLAVNVDSNSAAHLLTVVLDLVRA